MDNEIIEIKDHNDVSNVTNLALVDINKIFHIIDFNDTNGSVNGFKKYRTKLGNIIKIGISCYLRKPNKNELEKESGLTYFKVLEIKISVERKQSLEFRYDYINMEEIRLKLEQCLNFLISQY